MPLYNPAAASSTLTVRDIDGTPSITATVIEATNGSVTDQGGGVARISTATGGIAESILDAKGDLIVASAADTAGREPVGADGTFLEANAASTRGVRWGTPSGGSTFPLGLAAPDKIPASPGAHDEEFEGTADTLPTNWAWVSAAPPIWKLNSWMPSMLLIERSAETTERKLRHSSFTMAATSGLWMKIGNGQTNASSSQYEWIIYDSASSDGYGFGIHNGTTALARQSTTGTLANRGTWAIGTSHSGSVYLGVKRVSNTWTTFFSYDGVHWQQIQSADSFTFTVDRLEMRWSTDNSTGNPRASVDWIRYRTDNEFPRP